MDLTEESRSTSNRRGLVRRFAFILAALPVLVGLVLIEETAPFAWMNLLAQATIFVLVACVPAWRTGRMSYVDIAWPAGLVVIGALTLAHGDGSATALSVAVAYLLMGGRMTLGALLYWRHGEFDQELPRYVFQRLRWKTASLGNERRDLVAEILVQAVANCTSLAVPAAVAIAAQDESLGIISLVGLAAWLASWVLESVADLQKRAFVQSAAPGSSACCEVGLWKYSRHPNYFFQWMQWNSLLVVCLPLLIGASHRLPMAGVVLLAGGLVGAVVSMLWCLVFYTGAVPAEYYSARKRPAYRDYQARVNRFVPGPAHRPAAVHAVGADERFSGEQRS